MLFSLANTSGQGYSVRLHGQTQNSKTIKNRRTHRKKYVKHRENRKAIDGTMKKTNRHKPIIFPTEINNKSMTIPQVSRRIRFRGQLI